MHTKTSLQDLYIQIKSANALQFRSGCDVFSTHLARRHITVLGWVWASRFFV